MQNLVDELMFKCFILHERRKELEEELKKQFY